MMTFENGKKTLPLFVGMSFLICLVYAIAFSPITAGDSSAYISMAKHWLGDSADFDQGTQSPLYGLLLALFLKIFGENNYLIFVVYFQFLLIFMTSIIVFRITCRLTHSIKLSYLAGFLFLTSLPVVFFGYMILTETLTVFLFMLVVYLLTGLNDFHAKTGPIILCGFLTGLLILARFNLIFAPVWIICIIIFYQLFKERKYSLRTLGRHLFVFLLPLLIILNLWCLRNYEKYGFYFLFPSSGQVVSRNAVLVVLTDQTPVADHFVEVKRIFLAAKKTLTQPKHSKGSLLDYFSGDVSTILYEMNSGFHIYSAANPALLEYYGIENTPKAQAILTKSLAPFYREVAQNHRMKILFLRTCSLFFSFRASPSTLPDNIRSNLNRLPSVFFVIYKSLFMLASVSVIVLTFYYLGQTVKRRDYGSQYVYLVLLAMWLYFPIINFIHACMIDSDRYKYPGDPLLVILLLFYLQQILAKPPVETSPIVISFRNKPI